MSLCWEHLAGVQRLYRGPYDQTQRPDASPGGARQRQGIVRARSWASSSRRGRPTPTSRPGPAGWAPWPSARRGHRWAFFVLLSTEVGQQAWLDQQVQVIESFGVKLNDAAVPADGTHRRRMARYIDGRRPARRHPASSSAIIAGILLGIFNALLGGDASFKQVFAIVAHSGLITRAADASSRAARLHAGNACRARRRLGVFVPFLERKVVSGAPAGHRSICFRSGGTLSLAIGLGVLYKRRTAPIATSLFIVYFVIVAAIAAVRSALS